MRIVIMGSGGVGAYVGARLQAAGEDLAFIARGAHLQALQTEGLRLEHPQHPLHLPQVQASDDPAELARVARPTWSSSPSSSATPRRQRARSARCSGCRRAS